MKKLSDRIPMMFRSQIEGRCQIQRLPNAQKDVYQWTDEWIEGVEENVPIFSKNIKTKVYSMTWRFVTNSGQDEGIIRPVIGANGFPVYPGSSMKGAFLRECTKEEASNYCGDADHPGILRFHGGYPQDLDWIDQELVDVVHPQEIWQVKSSANHSAFTQISLYQPTLVFGISSNKKLENVEWERIWQIWEKALTKGIGSRVSAGYGQAKLQRDNCLFTISLKGQGLASKLVNNEGEFRPNGFKAALRGHTLRLLGGVTDEPTAEALTKELWGGFASRNGAIVGQLGVSFTSINLVIDKFTYTPGRNPFDMPIYDLQEGQLNLLCLKNLSEKQQKNLKIFLRNLIQFSVLLGGFGKSWRRVDHRLFFSEYFGNNDKPMIGCHWELIKKSQKLCLITELQDVTDFLNKLQENMKKFVTYKRKELNPQGCSWREAFHLKNVQVWGRIAENKLDSEAIKWFHGDYQRDKTIKQSDLTGKLNKIGRIWHRMYPQYIVTENEKVKQTGKYIELLTIFSDNSSKTQNFLTYLDTISSFHKLWGE